MEEINRKVAAYKQQLIEGLPSYAFQYDEGERYVSQTFMVRIEGQVADFKTGLMEEELRILFKATESTKASAKPAPDGATPAPAVKKE